MQKVFKLIKEYPGSPELDFTIDLSKIVYDKLSGHKQSTQERWEIFKKDIPNYPEYWQEIKENFEILSFDYPTKETMRLRNDGNYFLADRDNTNEKGVSLKQMIANIDSYGAVIKSVKRLSDNKVFNIGDTISNGNINYCYQITKFVIPFEYSMKTNCIDNREINYVLAETTHGLLSVDLRNAKHL